MLTVGQNRMTKIKQWINKCRELLGSLLFPPRCPVCDEILEPEEAENGIHLACDSKLYYIQGAVCMHCGRPLGDNNPHKEYCFDCIGKCYAKESYISQGKSLYLYKGVAKKMMYRFKYSNKQEYAAFFAKETINRYAIWMKQRKIDVIVPVPMYRKKQRRRGYNQAECFARQLSLQTGIPMDTRLVYRVQDTAPQKGLDANARRNNLKNAFQKGEFVVQYTCAMVVDDIYTTGSTAEAVARELKNIGIHRVYLLTVCIGEDR